MKSLLHACKCLLGWAEPASQVTDAERALLGQYARDAQIIVEIGCYEGKTTAFLAQGTKGVVYSIDPFFTGRLGICYGELIARRHCQRNGCTNVKFIRGLSHDVAAQFDTPIDFIFIDADHSYEAIKQDWADWFPKMKAGGIIALHDCRIAPNSPDYLGSMKFYDEDIPAIKGLAELEQRDSLGLFRVVGN